MKSFPSVLLSVSVVKGKTPHKGTPWLRFGCVSVTCAVSPTHLPNLCHTHGRHINTCMPCNLVCAHVRSDSSHRECMVLVNINTDGRWMPKIVRNANLFEKCLFTIFVPINPPLPKQRSYRFLLNLYEKAVKQNCEHSAKIENKTLRKLQTNRIMNKWAFLKYYFGQTHRIDRLVKLY